MKRILKHICCIGMIFASTLSHAKKSSTDLKKLEYKIGDQLFEGTLVTPTKLGTNSGLIVMVHNWMGITDETLKQAKRFAVLGYTVFAADIYGKGVRPKDQKEAGQLATKYKSDRELFRKHLLASMEFAQKQVPASTKVAVLGYCFGGTGAIELVRAGAPVQIAISFHGGLDSPKPEDGNNIKGYVLALHGEDDPYVSATDVAAFESEMKTNKVPYRLVKYPGAVHSFTDETAGKDNSKGAAYNANADQKSFVEAKDALTNYLSTP